MSPRLIAFVLASFVLVGCGDDAATPVDAGVDAFIPEAVGSFPDNFLWGTGIAAYQVEGGLINTDWHQWESTCTNCSGASADDGPKFLEHYEADFDAAVAMHNNSIRIGLEWARLFPTAKSFTPNAKDLNQFAPDLEAVALYHRIIKAARDRHLNVMVTVIHFSLPTWINDMSKEDINGWDDPGTPAAVGRYAGWLAAEYGTDVDWWVTINEPYVNLTGGYIAGDVPPGKHFAVAEALKAGEAMIVANARAYDAIHEHDATDVDGDGEAAWVSIASHNRVFLPTKPEDAEQVAAAEMLRYILNDYFLNAAVYGNIDRNFDFDADDEGDLKNDDTLKGRLDYIGLNYYGLVMVVKNGTESQFPLTGLPLFNDLDRYGVDAERSDFGWAIYPQGFRQVLDELVPYQLPIVITENGVADANESLRPRFLIEHLYAINKAIDDGLNIRGYFHWALIDNYEWTSGYCPRFGLYHVDFEDPARPRTRGAAADVYQQIIDAKTVAPSLYASYPTYESKTHCPRIGL